MTWARRRTGGYSRVPVAGIGSVRAVVVYWQCCQVAVAPSWGRMVLVGRACHAARLVTALDAATAAASLRPAITSRVARRTSAEERATVGAASRRAGRRTRRARPGH